MARKTSTSAAPPSPSPSPSPDPFRLALADSLERTARIVRAGKPGWLVAAQAEMTSLGEYLTKEKIDMVRKMTIDILKMKEN